MLQPMREALQQLRQEGLIGVHLLRTFFSCRFQPPRL
jgi:DNA-binding GntR family transcriptional regulator